MSPPSRPTYFLFNPNGDPVGPADAEHIARGVVTGKVPESALVSPAGAAPDACAWRPLGSVPQIVEAVRVAHERARRPSRAGTSRRLRRELVRVVVVALAIAIIAIFAIQMSK